MIKTIIFDFGDVFINLDKTATSKAFTALGGISTHELKLINDQYETGQISTDTFIRSCNALLPKASETEIKAAWNAILLDFPIHRLHFLQQLVKQERFQLLLLSNTNALHIDWIIKHIPFFDDFKVCFDSFYLSHQIHFRKPNKDIFEFVLQQHHLIPSETLFIDDTSENTDVAASLGIHVWNNDPKCEDITELFTIKSELF